MGTIIGGILTLGFAVFALYFHANSPYKGETSSLVWVCVFLSAIFGLVTLCMAAGVRPPEFSTTEREHLIQLCSIKPDCDLESIMMRLEGKKNGN